MSQSHVRFRWPSLSAGIRFVVGGVFVFAGVTKMIDPWSFAAAIESFRVVPTGLVGLLAIILPPLELIAGGFWMANRAPMSAAVTILGLGVVFLVALIAALVRGVPAECGCFGAFSIGGSTATAAILRDMLLMTATGYWILISTRASETE